MVQKPAPYGVVDYTLGADYPTADKQNLLKHISRHSIETKVTSYEKDDQEVTLQIISLV